jgi:transposase
VVGSWRPLDVERRQDLAHAFAEADPGEAWLLAVFPKGHRIAILDEGALLVRREFDRRRAVAGEFNQLLRGFGLKVGDVSRGKLAARIRELVSGHAMLERIAEPMLTAREALWSEFNKLHREVLAIVKEDQVCRRLMTVPGVGAVVSLTYRAGVDDPARFAKSKSVGAFFGLTPKRYQSGDTDVTGAITRVGDASVRTALHDAANALLSRATRFSTLKRWPSVGDGRRQAAGHAEGEGGAGT